MIALAKNFSSPAAETNSTSVLPKTNSPSLNVRSYVVQGNTVLRPEQFSLLTNYTGSEVTFPRLREGLGELQLLYRNLGFATISVTLPKQKPTNGVIQVKVVEGKLNRISISGNHYYSSNNIRRSLPSLSTNVLLNTKWFQPELDQANASADRQIYPVISPGPDPGTTDLELKVKDRLPLHAHMEINNKSTPGTPPLRIDTAIQYNNLWQLNHQIGLEYNFSPLSMKSDSYSPNFFDQPMVASYSGFYRIPLGFAQGLRETYDRLPVDFGYDQVTHKFNLPAPTGNPELTIYASRSASDTPPRLGAVTNLADTGLAKISAQFAQRDLTFNQNLGTKLAIPLREFAGLRSSFLLGFDYKDYKTRSYTTNLTYFDLYSFDQVSGTYTLINSQTIRLGTNHDVSLNYFPLSVGWVGARPDKWGTTSFSVNENVFLSPLESARTNFQVIAGSKKAGGDYTTISAALTREQKISGDWSALFRANGQWASAPLINNEQFALGGTSGVRGYREGEVYGDSGWRVLLDLRAPPVNVGYFPTGRQDIPTNVRCSWFMDYGDAYDLDRPFLARHTVSLWGTGLSAFLTAGEHFDARLTLAWALQGTVISRAGSAQAYFSVGCQF